jgi:hypothetical protein
MANEKTAGEKKVKIGDFESGVNTGLADADARRADSFDQLRLARRAVGTGVGREQARLALKYGDDHPRVADLAARASFNEGMVKDITLEAARARTDIPVVGEDEWVLHGHVRDAQLRGVANLTVALYDDGGEWQRGLGHTCTEENGYFRLRNSTSAVREGRPVYMRVLSRNSEHLYADKSALRPEPGRLDYREVVLTGEAQTCAPPALGRDEPLSAPDAWVVRGRVSDSNNRGLPGLTVSLYDKDFFFDDRLGQTETDQNGNYSLAYRTGDFRDLIERKPDIYLKVMDQKGNTLYTSKKEIRYEAGRVEIINITINR